MATDRTTFPDKRPIFFRDDPDGPVRFYFSMPDRGLAVDGIASPDDIRHYPEVYAAFIEMEARAKAPVIANADVAVEPAAVPADPEGEGLVPSGDELEPGASPRVDGDDRPGAEPGPVLDVREPADPNSGKPDDGPAGTEAAADDVAS